ncbi:MAG: hypothetical protein AAF483_23065 [Planctomycetota bacterium]
MKTATRILLFTLCLMLSACMPPGQRLLDISIEVDGQAKIEAIYGVPDYTPVEDMWDELSVVEFQCSPEEAAGIFESYGSIEGEVVITIRHVQDVLASSTVNDLLMVQGRNKASWKISPDEIQRLNANSQQQ